jgi:hypothetical protein
MNLQGLPLYPRSAPEASYSPAAFARQTRIVLPERQSGERQCPRPTSQPPCRELPPGRQQRLRHVVRRKSAFRTCGMPLKSSTRRYPKGAQIPINQRRRTHQDIRRALEAMRAALASGEVPPVVVGPHCDEPYKLPVLRSGPHSVCNRIVHDDPDPVQALADEPTSTVSCAWRRCRSQADVPHDLSGDHPIRMPVGEVEASPGACPGAAGRRQGREKRERNPCRRRMPLFPARADDNSYQSCRFATAIHPGMPRAALYVDVAGAQFHLTFV